MRFTPPVCVQKKTLSNCSTGFLINTRKHIEKHRRKMYCSFLDVWHLVQYRRRGAPTVSESLRGEVPLSHQMRRSAKLLKDDGKTLWGL